MLFSKALVALAWAVTTVIAAPEALTYYGAGTSKANRPLNSGEGGLQRFEFVREHVPPGVRLARCSAPYYRDDDRDHRITPETIEVFRQQGIVNIISANSDAHNEEIKRALAAAGIAYTPVPVPDYEAATAEDFDWAWDSFDQHRGRGATLVWCGFGHGRTGMIVTALQMHMDHERGHLGPMWTHRDYRRNHVEDQTQEDALNALWSRLDSQPPPRLLAEEEADLRMGRFAALNCAAVLGSLMHMKDHHQRRRTLPEADAALLSSRQVTPLPLPASYDCDRARDILRRMEVPLPCQKIKNISLGVAFSWTYWAGTYDDVGATLEGTAGQADLHIKWQPTRGDHLWVPVDMKKAYGADEIDIDGINNITLNARGIAAWGTRNDEWKIQDVQLRAECADPGFKAREDKYVGINAWYGHPGGWSYGVQKATVAGFPVVPSDWAFSPPCAVIKELFWEFKLDNWYWGGTWDALSFSIGDGEKIPLGGHLAYGTSKMGAVNMWEVFGAAEVDIRNLTQVRIYDEYGTEGNGDAWALHGITFVATCANVDKQMIMKRWQKVDQWYSHVDNSWAWEGKIYPVDWLEIV